MSKKISKEELQNYFLDPKYRREKFNSFYRKYRTLIIISLLIIVIGFSWLVWYIIQGLPTFEELENPKPSLASTVYSIDGKQLGQFFIERRIPVSYDSIPQNLINALIATEDRKFYQHWGVDLDRFVKAMFKTIFLSSKEGASTITQQLARNLYKLVDKEENYLDVALRKVREMITAVQLEKTYTKQEILEMYLNITYFGRGAYGVSSAAKSYFGKSVKDLTLPESALLVALLKSPSYYDPIKNPENAYMRRNLILRLMYETGYISEEEYEKAKDEFIRLNIISEYTQSICPHFIEYIRQQLSDKNFSLNSNIYRDGLKIYTTLNYKMQEYANQAVNEHLNEFQKLFNKNWKWTDDFFNSILDKEIKNNQAYILANSPELKEKIYNSLKRNKEYVDSLKNALQTIETGFVAIDQATGEIRAMVGGRNMKFMYGLNHVTQIKRQPGSAFKPIIYTTAIENGTPICTEISNEPLSIKIGNKVWTPKNSDGRTGGYLSLREALSKSVNLVSVRLIQEGLAPLNEIPNMAKRLGITSEIQPVYSIALGTSEVSPLELTSAYATIANSGIRVKPISILRIEDQNGMIIKDFKAEMEEAISAQTAYLMTQLMISVVDGGTASGIRRDFHLPAAGKTGTTQEYTDAWFVGFTPQLTAGVWVGFDNQKIKFTGAYGQGARAAAPIWAKFMAKVYADKSLGFTLKYFEECEGISKLQFCLTSLRRGQPRLAGEYCPSVITDIANSKFQYEKCDIHTERGTDNNSNDTIQW